MGVCPSMPVEELQMPSAVEIKHSSQADGWASPYGNVFTGWFHSNCEAFVGQFCWVMVLRLVWLRMELI